MEIHSFTVGPFQENTYLLYNNAEAWIVDPGFYDNKEQQLLLDFLEEINLKLTRNLNTHAHIDHVMGNAFIFDKYGLLPEMHKADLPTLDLAEQAASLYGLNYDASPQPEKFLEEGDKLKFDGEELEILFVPGHAPGHVVFVNHSKKWVVNGDCLFNRSIGRTDLPGGNHDVLLNSIREQLFTLPEDYVVYCGHGPSTTIGEEKVSNPFL
jgi:hydroxyacylglutathione hydrolase